MVMRVRMRHSHRDGWAPPEIAAFADSICFKAAPLPLLKSFETEQGVVKATYESPTAITAAELNFTADIGAWKDRKWKTIPVDISRSDKKVRATLPTGATAYYINLTDERGLVVSSELAIPDQ